METEEVRVLIAKRFVDAVDELIKEKKVNTYSEMASFLGLGKSSISDMKAGRSGIDVIHIYSTIKAYPILNPAYILMGEGEIIRKESIQNQKLLDEIKSLNNEKTVLLEELRQANKENKDSKDELIKIYKELAGQNKSASDKKRFR